MSTILRTVGIDISKDWLDAFAAPRGEHPGSQTTGPASVG